MVRECLAKLHANVSQRKKENAQREKIAFYNGQIKPLIYKAAVWRMFKLYSTCGRVEDRLKHIQKKRALRKLYLHLQR